MPVKISTDQNTLNVSISGDIDHHTAASVRTEIDHAVRTSPVEQLIIDFSEVSFMDSSGIGLIMGRYKLMSELGGVCVIADPPPYIRKVMKLSGIDKLCRIISTRSGIPPEARQSDNQNGGILL